MDTLEPLIEGYLSYLRDVSRKTVRTVTDVRCMLRRAVRGFHHCLVVLLLYGCGAA